MGFHAPLVKASIENLLVFAGIFFLAVAIIGQISGKIDPGKPGRVAGGVFGTVLLIIGLIMHIHTPAPPPTPQTPTPEGTTTMTSPTTETSSGVLRYGDVIQGQLTTDDEKGPRGPKDEYTFQGSQSDKIWIQVDVISGATGSDGPYVLLYDPSGQQIARGELGKESQSRLPFDNQTVTLPVDGTYTITVTSQIFKDRDAYTTSGATFTYRLRLNLE